MAFSLIKLSIDDGHDIYDMLQEIPADDCGYINSVHGKTFKEYKQWLVSSNKSSQKTEIEDGWKVPQSVFWLLSDEKPVGVGKIRHFLTDKLLQDGGSIGYAIRPNERNKGYGKILLKELLIEAGKLNIENALITVRNNNITSIKVALFNGGVIEKTDEKRHYIWINCFKPVN